MQQRLLSSQHSLCDEIHHEICPVGFEAVSVVLYCCVTEWHFMWLSEKPDEGKGQKASDGDKETGDLKHMLRSLKNAGVRNFRVQKECQNRGTKSLSWPVERKLLLPSCVNSHMGNVRKNEILFWRGAIKKDNSNNKIRNALALLYKVCHSIPPWHQSNLLCTWG